jgi:hypothetical protein
VSLALLAGIAFGSPILRRDDPATVTDVMSITDLANLQPEPTATPGEKTVTIHVYVYVFEPEPTPSPTPVEALVEPTTTPAAAPTTKAAPPTEVAQPPESPAYTPPVDTPAAPSPSPSPTYGNGDSSTLGSINKWRSIYGLAPYQWSNDDAAMAAQCGEENKDNGDPVHSHFESGGQVISPGTDLVVGDFMGLTPFELSLAAWLCEKPQDPQLTSAHLCDTLTAIGTAAGTLFTIGGSVTGHHDAILSTDFKTVGCAYTPRDNAAYPLWAGYWVCNFGR